MEQNIHMLLDFGVSDHQPWQVLLSMVLFTVLYGIGAVLWVWLIQRQVRKGMDQPGLHEGDSKRLKDVLYGPNAETELEPLSFKSESGATTTTADNKEL